MLETLEAVRYDGRMSSGKSKPLKITCHDQHGNEIEVVVKLSKLLERGTVGLIAEAIAGMLALDLGLPVAKPYLVRLDPSFIESIGDPQTKTVLLESVAITFGCARFPPGFNLVTEHSPIAPPIRPQAAEIFAFDALIQNSDRLVSNPNCLSNGAQFAIFDHELAFIFDILFWKPPWEEEGLKMLETGVQHLFRGRLRGQHIDLSRFLQALKALSTEQCEQYVAALPVEWDPQQTHIEKITGYIGNLRANSDAAVNEVLRVLS